LSKNEGNFSTFVQKQNERFILRRYGITGINWGKALMPHPPRRDIPSVLPLGAQT
jgi:hypothetical protein